MLDNIQGRALALHTDVTDYDQVKKLVDAAMQKYGRIDVMLNNAGLMPHSPLERLKNTEAPLQVVNAMKTGREAFIEQLRRQWKAGGVAPRPPPRTRRRLS